MMQRYHFPSLQKTRDILQKPENAVSTYGYQINFKKAFYSEK